MIDFRERNSPNWNMVVTQMPFAAIGFPDPHHLSMILDLPPGTLTQRTLIYAVRMHPEGPASASGNVDPILCDEAAKHSQHQADLCVQGHHQWGPRFQRISYRMSNGLTPKEVCAESWPGEDLVDAAIECVHSWRQSPGHWSAVRRHHPRFAFDMKRGRNGVWYATGLFANRGN